MNYFYQIQEKKNTLTTIFIYKYDLNISLNFLLVEVFKRVKFELCAATTLTGPAGAGASRLDNQWNQ